MSGIPPWESFRVKKIPTTRPDVPEEEITSSEQRLAVRICNVCKQEFTEEEKPLICAKCGQYCHAEHSNKLDMAPHCNVCIIETVGVSKLGFKLLHALMSGYKKSRIKKALKLSEQGFELATSELMLSEMVSEKRFLIFEKHDITSKALELFPILDEIYGNEKDVELFKQKLLLVR